MWWVKSSTRTKSDHLWCAVVSHSFRMNVLHHTICLRFLLSRLKSIGRWAECFLLRFGSRQGVGFLLWGPRLLNTRTRWLPDQRLRSPIFEWLHRSMSSPHMDARFLNRHHQPPVGSRLAGAQPATHGGLSSYPPPHTRLHGSPAPGTGGGGAAGPSPLSRGASHPNLPSVAAAAGGGASRFSPLSQQRGGGDRGIAEASDGFVGQPLLGVFAGCPPHSHPTPTPLPRRVCSCRLIPILTTLALLYCCQSSVSPVVYPTLRIPEPWLRSSCYAI